MINKNMFYLVFHSMMIINDIPGQGLSLQIASSSVFPVQVLPSPTEAGLIHVLFLCL